MDIPVDSIGDISSITLRDHNGTVQEFDLQDELRISRDNLQEDFLTQPIKYVYWVAVLEKVRLYAESANLELEKLQGELYEPCRNALINSGTAKPTKDQINSLITTQESYQVAKQSALLYESQVKFLQGVVRAWEQRREMLIQYGADNRKAWEQTKKMNTNSSSFTQQGPVDLPNFRVN